MEIVQEGESKNGLHYVIRYPRLEDVQSVWEYINRLSKERTFIRFQGEEVSLQNEEEFVMKKIQAAAEQKGVTLFLLVDDKVHGISDIELGDRTESHVGVFGLSVDQSVRGQGLGETLMSAVLAEAGKRLADLKIITLQAKAPNAVAISLYEKLGFKKYGLLPSGTRHQGELVDEVFMYKEV